MTFPAQLDPRGEKMPLGLPGGVTVSLPVCHAEFKTWSGTPTNFDCGRKPVLDYGGEAFFAVVRIGKVRSRSR
jgi:hypothetical protein